MSRTYIGPFGRILPVPDDVKPPGPEQDPIRKRGTRAKMTSYPLPLLPIPQRLQFGTDIRPGFTEPTRYETMSHLRRSVEPIRSANREQLPSVSQLLTPASQCSVPPSPFSPSGSTNSVSKGSLDQMFRRQRTAAEPQARTEDYQPHNSYAAPQRQETTLRRDHIPLDTGISQYPSPYTGRQDPVPSSYNAYPEQFHPSFQHAQIAPAAAPSRSYPIQNSAYGSVSSSTSAEHPSEHDPLNVPKPLLRVVGEDNVPGEGPCWIYEDGSHCRKMIDGEAVNAQWGVTKAGKPRKRLAIACMTCREKKIKCDPGEPKCVQCDKFGRECRFQSAVRGQHNRPESPSYEHQANTPSSMNTKADSPYDSFHSPCPEAPSAYQSPAPKQNTSSADLKSPKRRADSRSTSVETKLVRKKIRHDASDSGEAASNTPSIDFKAAHSSQQSTVRPLAECKDPIERLEPLLFTWLSNSHEIDPVRTSHYMEMYFIHINATTYCMFPRAPFLRWLRNGNAKSPADVMVIYSMLAMGSVFSSRPARKAEGSLFAKIARQMVEKNHGNFSLQLTQSRLILALYHFSQGDSQKAWDYAGSAVRATAGLKLNTEEGVTSGGSHTDYEYGLDQQTFEECQRRTFWAAFLMDRMCGYCTGHLTMLHKEDIFVRLPCRYDIYENQIKTTTPYFNNGIIDQRPNEKNENSNLGDIAYMVQISTIWSDVLAHIYRSSHQSPEVYLASYEAFYSNICNRLSGWASSLPSNLRFNRFNLESNVDNGHIGTFVSIHAFYHITFMKLNRHIRHGCLPTSTISHNIREAVRHAQELLDIIDTISAVDRKKRLTPNAPGQDPLDFSFSTPFAGYAVLAAIDILSAAGSLGPVFTDTLRRMNSCLDVIDELAHFWASAKGQRKAIRHRIEELANSVIDNGPGRHAWVLKIPIEKTYTADQDAFYPQNTITRGADLRLLKAMDVDVEEGDVLFIEEGDLARPESCTGYGFYPAR